MSDVMPNYAVARQRLKAQIAQQQATIAQQWLDILEMADRKARHMENINAAESAIEEYQEQLKSLEDEHGKLTNEKVRELADTLTNDN